jgi:hypothetical protein
MPARAGESLSTGAIATARTSAAPVSRTGDNMMQRVRTLLVVDAFWVCPCLTAILRLLKDHTRELLSYAQRTDFWCQICGFVPSKNGKEPDLLIAG